MNVVRSEMINVSKEELKRKIEEIKKELERKLTPAQARYIERYVDGLARFIAYGPTGEPREEYEKEYLLVKALLLENAAKMEELSRRWLERLKEFVLAE